MAVQITAIAHVNDLVLVTLNTRDFGGFKQIAVENWSKRRADRSPGPIPRRG